MTVLRLSSLQRRYRSAQGLISNVRSWPLSSHGRYSNIPTNVKERPRRAVRSKESTSERGNRVRRFAARPASRARACVPFRSS